MLMIARQQSDLLHVLLVEDNDLDVEIAKQVFARSGVAAQLHIVHDGPEALQFLYRRRYPNPRARLEAAPQLPDLTLLDLNLPTGSGADILRQMKADPRLSPIPVVVLTGNGNERMLRKCMELGANLYLLKPITNADVMNIVADVQRYWSASEKLERGAA